MKLLPRRRPADISAESIEADDAERSGNSKGRPTPKRRDAQPRRTPITAPPQNRREAMRWQREQARIAREQKATQQSNRSAAAPARNSPEFREAMRRGDESVLPKRDKGPVRKLARDWVDSRRMISNYLMVLIIPMVLSFGPRSALVQYLNLFVLLAFVVMMIEWYVAGRKILALARERGLQTRETPIGIGFYTASRAFMPRRWRLPAPTVQLGDKL